MLPYRTDEPLGALRSRHRALLLRPVAKGLTLCAFLLTLGLVGAPRPARVAATLGVVAAVLTWTAREWLRFRSLRVKLFDGGLVVSDGRAERQIGWGDLVAIEARVFGRSPSSRLDPHEGPRVFSLELRTRNAGKVTLPNLLQDFAQIEATLRAQREPPVTDRVIFDPALTIVAFVRDLPVLLR